MWILPPLAYSFVTMRDLRNIASQTPEGKSSGVMTSLNPMTKYIMQYQNMVGKEVIGIAAVGEKVFMGLSYYYNELVRETDPEKLRKNLNFLIFNQEFDRIQGRYNKLLKGDSKFYGNFIKVSKTTVSDTNLIGLANAETIKNRLYQVDAIRTKLLKEGKDELYINTVLSSNSNKYRKVDLIISQLLSAATDNAKELITDSNEYNKYVNKALSNIDKIKSLRAQARYDEIYNKIDNEIKKQEEEGLSKLDSAKSKLDNAHRTLNNTKNELDIAGNKLDSARSELDGNKAKLDAAKEELDKYDKELNDAKEKLEYGKDKINNELSNYGITYEDIDDTLSYIENYELTKDEAIALIPDNIPYHDETVNAISSIYDSGLIDDVKSFVENDITKNIADVLYPKFEKLVAVLIPPPPTLVSKSVISSFEPYL